MSACSSHRTNVGMLDATRSLWNARFLKFALTPTSILHRAHVWGRKTQLRAHDENVRRCVLSESVFISFTPSVLFAAIFTPTSQPAQNMSGTSGSPFAHARQRPASAHSLLFVLDFVS